jgi:hypothetical protein
LGVPTDIRTKISGAFLDAKIGPMKAGSRARSFDRREQRYLSWSNFFDFRNLASFSELANGFGLVVRDVQQVLQSAARHGPTRENGAGFEPSPA